MKRALQEHILRAAFLAPFAALLCSPVPGLADNVILGSAQGFAILGASTVTNTGATGIYGNLGVDPGTAITGFPPGVVTGGAIDATDAVAQQAQSDALGAYNTLAGMAIDRILTGEDLGGMTLTPGVYDFAASAQLTGTLTLDFTNNPGGAFVFQVGTTLTTGSNSVVNAIGGNALSGIYWQVGSSATLGTDTTFTGNILAADSISLSTNADILCGRAIALTGAVTMDTNEVSNNNSADDFGSYGFSGGEGAPEPGTLTLLSLGLGIGFLLRRKLPSMR